MGFDPFTMAILTIGSAAASGAMSASAASQQNKAIRRAMKSEQEAADLQTDQLHASFNKGRADNLKKASALEGHIRVLSGAKNIGTPGTTEALLRQKDYDEAENAIVMEENYLNQAERVRSGLQANLNTLASRSQNKLIAGISGAVGGAGTGLQIGLGLKEAGILKPPNVKEKAVT